MSQPIDMERTVAIGDEETTAAAEVNTDTGTLQVENQASGASGDASFFLEARLDDGFSWSTLAAFQNLANDVTEIDPSVDLSDVTEVRGRATENGGANAADIRLTLQTE